MSCRWLCMAFLATHRTVKLWDHQQRHPLMSYGAALPLAFVLTHVAATMRENLWFVLKDNTSNTNGGAESEVTVNSVNPK